MKKLLIAVLAAFALFCGQDSTPPPPPPPPNGAVGPGAQVSLEAIARQALACTGALTWSVQEANGGAVTQTGVYTAPACGVGYADGVYHVVAAGCGKTVIVALDVAEVLLSLTLTCAVVQGAACCTVPPVPMAPGQTAQWYAALSYSCHDVSVPSAPPALCP